MHLQERPVVVPISSRRGTFDAAKQKLEQINKTSL
jgi:hypothetical protein